MRGQLANVYPLDEARIRTAESWKHEYVTLRRYAV